ncbi:MAG TPA: hypothetical protein VIW94_05075 [Acidimicrobiia bacterium]
MRNRTMAFLLATAVVFGACADAGTDESVPGDSNPPTSAESSTPTDSEDEVVGQLEDQIETLSNAISSSETGQELSSAWNTLKIELAATVATLRTQGEVARDELESALDAFEEELDAIEVGEDVSAAWEELRTRLEQLTG